ncbi:MAG: sugar transporter, partial [Planctomycetaceae bacterium]
MRVIQFEIPGSGRRVGVVDGDTVRDLTSVRPGLTRLYQAFYAAQYGDQPLETLLTKLADAKGIKTHSYPALLEGAPGSGRPFLHPPLDHEDPRHVQITGTGLTHTGSMQSRDQMHATGNGATAEPTTDSAKMYQMGLEGGRPAVGTRGVAPEWFYKGNGVNLRGHRAPLEIPGFALDGGEEPELVGCYIIDADGKPFRLGFTLSNEWSDHATEKINYLYLAPSKLRVCAMGP